MSKLYSDELKHTRFEINVFIKFPNVYSLNCQQILKLVYYTFLVNEILFFVNVYYFTPHDV